MQFKIHKKKALLITFLIVLLVSLLVIAYLVVKAQFSQESMEDSKYKDIFTLCHDEESQSVCKGLIYEVNDNGDEECFKISFITPEYAFEEKEFCEKKDMINWDDRVSLNIQEEGMIPINLAFEYSSSLLSPSSLESLNFSLMTDEEVNTMSENLLENSNLLPKIRTQRNVDKITKGYYLTHYNVFDIKDEIGPKSFILYKANIQDLEVKNDKIVVKIAFESFDKTHSAEFSLNSININSTIYNTEDFESLNKLDNLGDVQVVLFYLEDVGELTNDEIIQYCNTDDHIDAAKVFCSNSTDKSYEEIQIENVEEYFSTSLDKESSLIELDKFVPIAILNN